MRAKSEQLPSTEELPYEKRSIVKYCRVLTHECYSAQNRMDKSWKYTLGSDLASSSIKLTEAVYDALDEDIASENKMIKINNIKPLIYQLLIKARLSNDLGQVDNRVHCSIIKNIFNVKQACDSWIGYMKRRV